MFLNLAPRQSALLAQFSLPAALFLSLSSEGQEFLGHFFQRKGQPPSLVGREGVPLGWEDVNVGDKSANKPR